MKILLTGGSGLLGKELQKHIKCDAPTHRELDITNPKTFKKFVNREYELVIHAAAYTEVTKAEIEPLKCAEVNITGTLNVSQAFEDSPLVYISSEYAKSPVNFYSKTKQIAENLIHLARGGYEGTSYLTIRTLFKPNPFPWDKAFKDQYTQGDYVDVIAPLIAKKINEWNKTICGAVYVGTGRKTMLELARRTKPDVQAISVKDIKDVVIPTDYL